MLVENPGIQLFETTYQLMKQPLVQVSQLSFMLQNLILEITVSKYNFKFLAGNGNIFIGRKRYQVSQLTSNIDVDTHKSPQPQGNNSKSKHELAVITFLYIINLIMLLVARVFKQEKA